MMFFTGRSVHLRISDLNGINLGPTLMIESFFDRILLDSVRARVIDDVWRTSLKVQ